MEGQGGTGIVVEGTHVEHEATPDNQNTNTSHVHTQTILDGYSAPKPANTHHTPHIQPKDLKTSTKSQRNPE